MYRHIFLLVGAHSFSQCKRLFSMQQHAWVPTLTNVLLFSHPSPLADVSWFSTMDIHKQWEMVDHLTLWSTEELADGDENADVIGRMFPPTSYRLSLAASEPVSKLWHVVLGCWTTVTIKMLVQFQLKIPLAHPSVGHLFHSSWVVNNSSRQRWCCWYLSVNCKSHTW